jgi:hypothetical protein
MSVKMVISVERQRLMKSQTNDSKSLNSGKCFWLLGSNAPFILKKIKADFKISKNYENKSGHCQCGNLQAYKISIRNSLYYGYTKVTNYGKICRFENIYNRSTCLSYLCSPKYKVFEYELLHVCVINRWLHLHIFS